jgi:hypothetical protein
MARALGSTLERIQSSRGRWSALEVVNAARPKNSPIHGLFEWNNSIAAERFRLAQARDHIAHLTVVVMTDKKETTMSVAFSIGRGDGYTAAETVLSSDELRGQLLAQALSEARTWRNRYQFIKELAGVFAALDEVKKQA